MASQQDGGGDAVFTVFKGNGAAAHGMTDKTTRATAWHEIVRASLKANDVKLIVYVPDRVFTAGRGAG